MKTRCEGCGIKIQTVDPKKPGYIDSEVYLKNPDNFLCERCFNLKHYNKYSETEIDEKKFYDNIDKISKTNALVVYVVDGFDLEGTFVDKIKEWFPKNKVLMIVNKFDLFLSSTKQSKVKKYISDMLADKDIHVSGLLLISSKKEEDIEKVFREIIRLKGDEDVYLFGVTNVGKSTLINELSKIVCEKKTDITISNMPSTTLDVIKIPLLDHTYLYDMPGIINEHQMTYYLDKNTLNKVLPKKYIKPKTFQLNEKQTLFISGFAYFNYLEGDKASFVTNFSNELVIHRTKLENAKDFFEKHIDDILLYPSESIRCKLGKMKSQKFMIDGKKDIAISGLGFLTVHGKGIVEVVTYEKIKVAIRGSLL